VGTDITLSEDYQAEASPSVLLVDDDEVNLMVTALALRDRGFSVTEVSGGEAALEALREQVPDIVVLDAMMPGLNGFDTCLRLRATAGLEHRGRRPARAPFLRPARDAGVAADRRANFRRQPQL
jgi:CheY-like chemotaxis protein